MRRNNRFCIQKHCNLYTNIMMHDFERKVNGKIEKLKFEKFFSERLYKETRFDTIKKRVDGERSGMKTRESMENYLETILILEKSCNYVRAIDIATELGFSKPSVSNAMKKLRAEGYITVEENRILLTDAGRAVAEAIYERHCVIADSLMRIGVSRKTALEDACRMEHIISEETFDCMKRHHQASLDKK